MACLPAINYLPCCLLLGLRADGHKLHEKLRMGSSPLRGLQPLLTSLPAWPACCLLLQVGALVLEAFPPRGIMHFLEKQHTQVRSSKRPCAK